VILVVDDDGLIRALVTQVLEGQGWQVEAFASPVTALARLAEVEPELVLSDVMMPGMDGLAFRAEFARRFPARRTPFLFLSGLGTEHDQVRGLEAGADDYLVKPVLPALLVAKVRSLLRRAGVPRPAAFQGDLARCPFARIVEFCEGQGFTGEVEVTAEGRTASVVFHGGQLDVSAAGTTALVDRLFELRGGQFRVLPALPDFGLLGPAGAPAPPGAAAPPTAPQSHPVGRLSAITAGTRCLQLQTEFTTMPHPAVVSVVVLEGRTVLKRTSAAVSPDREERQRQVEAHHAEVEQEVRERLARAGGRRLDEPPAEPSPTARRDALIEQGLAAFLAGDHRAALETWEAAAGLDPAHRSLQVNLAVVRRKLGIRAA